MRTEIRASFAGGDSSSETILVRLHRVRPRRKPTGRREDFTEASPCDAVPKAARKATAFVSGFKTNPVDAAFLNGHMIRAMDYNDIYWKADPCHPSDLIAAPLALCESEGLSGKDLILATIIAYEIEMRLCEIGGQESANTAGITQR